MWVVHYNLSILNYILDSPKFRLLKRIKKTLEGIKSRYQKFLSPYWIYKYYKDKYYYRDRRKYIGLLWVLWRIYFRYNHILPKWERKLFRDLMAFFINYWCMCEINRSFRTFFLPMYEVLNPELLHAFKKSRLFYNKGYHKIFVRKNYRLNKIK
jgi:hypothetical protein